MASLGRVNNNRLVDSDEEADYHSRSHSSRRRDDEETDENSDNPVHKHSLEKRERKGEKGFEVSQAFTTIPFFENLDLRTMRKLTNNFHRNTYNGGQVIVEEGKSASAFFVLVRGSVKVTAHNSEGKEIELARKSMGSYFGDVALTGKTIEPVTVTALEDCIIFSISPEEFRKFSEENPEFRVSLESTSGGTNALQIQLKSIPFFSHIEEFKLSQLSSLLEIKRCKEGECICKQGDDANGFYILLSGRINVSAMGAAGRQVHLNTLTAGDWFGEIALIQNTQRTATLTTIQPCTLLYLSKEKFSIFLQIAPEIQENKILEAIITRRTANSLKTIPLFSFLVRKKIGPLTQFDERKLQLLGELFRFQQVAENVTVIRDGEKADAFYIIVKGTVVIKTRRNDDEKSDLSSVSSSSSSAVSSNAFATLDRKEVALAELGKNEFFGEIALVNNTQRTATVVTSSPCLLLKLLAEDFQKFVEIVPEVKGSIDRVISVRTTAKLSQIPFFRSIKENKPWSKLELLGSMLNYEHFAAGDQVVREGEVGDKFYIIVDGSVEVCKTIQGKTGPERVVLEVLNKNSWFGEIALIKETTRIATIQCKEDCLFLTMTKNKFTKFTQIAPDLYSYFSSLVTHRTANVIRSIDFFALNIKENKPWSKMELLSSLFDFETLEKDGILMREGDLDDKSNKFYIVATGSMQCSKKKKSEEPPPKPAAFPTSAASSSSSSSAASERKSEDEQKDIPSKSHSPSLSFSSTGSSPGYSDEFESEAETTRVLRQGAFFNEVSLMERLPRAMTVTARETTVLFTLTKDKFFQFLRVAPEVKTALSRLYPNENFDDLSPRKTQPTQIPNIQAALATSSSASSSTSTPTAAAALAAAAAAAASSSSSSSASASSGGASALSTGVQRRDSADGGDLLSSSSVQFHEEPDSAVHSNAAALSNTDDDAKQPLLKSS